MTFKVLIGDYTGIKKEVIQKHQYFSSSFHYEINMDLLLWLIKIEPQIVIYKPGALESEEYQFELGQELCRITQDLTIFTHSSLLIQGIRYGVCQKYINHKDVEILFYKPSGECLELHINEHGIIEPWPKGFMNTNFRASNLLLKAGLKALKKE